MKVRHLPAVLRHYPAFVLWNAPRMLAHTFRGSTWRSALGLEDERTVFRRYQAIRRTEREFLEREDVEPPPHAPTARAGTRHQSAILNQQ